MQLKQLPHRASIRIGVWLLCYVFITYLKNAVLVMVSSVHSFLGWSTKKSVELWEGFLEAKRCLPISCFEIFTIKKLKPNKLNNFSKTMTTQWEEHCWMISGFCTWTENNRSFHGSLLKKQTKQNIWFSPTEDSMEQTAVAQNAEKQPLQFLC